MVRVFRRPASALARHAPGRVAKRAARKHKVILESVTREKKKLRSVISFEAKAPPGYTFIPAGNPQLTGACKEICRNDGQKVYAVTTTPHMHTHNLSQHVHRIGYHFPSAVVAMVCMDLGLHLTAAGNVMPVHNNPTASKHKRANSEISQIAINTEARDVLRDLFPNIPDNDLNQIIKTAFQKGQRKVGTAAELPLARRAQLAAVAHIRHIYTDYDRLLKTTSFHEARSAVEEPTLAKLVEWRGDDENGKTVLEDIFREVIVISDDDDDDSDTEEGPPLHSTPRDRSVEVISSHPRTEELHTRPVNYAHLGMREAHLDLSDDEAPPGFRFIPEVPKKNKIDRRGFSRYHAWDRAINRYRNGTGQPRLYKDFIGQQDSMFTVPQPAQESIRPIPDSIAHQKPTATRQASIDPRATSNMAIPDPTRQRVFLHPVAEDRVSSQETVSLSQQKSGFMNIRNTQTRPLLNQHEPPKLRSPTEFPLKRSDVTLLPNRSLMEQVRVNDPRERLDRGLGDSNIPIFVGGPKESQGRTRFPLGTSPRTTGLPYGSSQANSTDHVLPSIETPPSAGDARHPTHGHLDQLTRTMTGGFSLRSVTPHHPASQEPVHQEIVDSSQAFVPKRRRVGVYRSAYEPIEHAESRSGVVPAVFEDLQTRQQYVSLGYAPSGSVNLSDEYTVRRRYMVPAKSPYLAGHYPENVSGSSNYATGSKPSSGALGSQRRYANFEDTSSPRGHHARPYFELSSHHRSPAPRALSGPFFATPGNEKHGTATLFHHPVSNIETTHDGNRTYQEGAGQLFHVSEPQATLRGNPPIQHNTSTPRVADRSIYADDFVRPIELNDNLRVANHPRHAHFQTSQPSEPGFGTPSAPYHPQREGGDLPVQNTLLGSQIGHFVSSKRITHEALDHIPMNEERISYYNRGDMHASSTEVRQHGRRGEPQLQSLRLPHEDGLHAIMDDRRQPAYMRRIGVSGPRDALPKGRTVVIVD